MYPSAKYGASAEVGRLVVTVAIIAHYVSTLLAVQMVAPVGYILYSSVAMSGACILYSLASIVRDGWTF